MYCAANWLGLLTQMLTEIFKVKRKNLRKVFQQHALLVCQRLEKEDYNRDGSLNCDGWMAAMLIPEVKQFLTQDELLECFHLIEDNNKQIAYVQWINEDPSLNQYSAML